jgi:hypothetical protein
MPLLRTRQRERCQIANIDRLDNPLRLTWSYDSATTFDPAQPPGQAPHIPTRTQHNTRSQQDGTIQPNVSATARSHPDF